MKNSQNGSAGIIALVIVGVLIFGIIGTVLWAVGIKNNFVGLQEDIIAANGKREANLSQYTLRIIEMAKVPKNQVADIKATVEAQIKARYGDGGSKSTVQILTENNISVSPELALNIQKEISGGRKDFENNENRLTEVKRIACTRVQTSPGDIVLRMFGYPTIHFGCNGDTVDNYKTILSESSKDTFETGVDKGVNF